MNNMELWIKIGEPGEKEDIQSFVLSLAEEDLLGEVPIMLYAEKTRAKCKLSHIYDVSEGAIPVLKEKYGDENVKLVDSGSNSSGVTPNNFLPDPLERIADALEVISSSLSSIDQSLELVSDVLSDSQVKNLYGSAIAVTGTINVIE